MLIHYIHYSSKIRHSFSLDSCPQSLYYCLHIHQVECYPMCFVQEGEIFGIFDSKYGAQLDGVAPLPALSCPSGPLRLPRFQGQGDSIFSIMFTAPTHLPTRCSSIPWGLQVSPDGKIPIAPLFLYQNKLQIPLLV